MMQVTTTSPHACIRAIGTAVPRFRAPQSTVRAWAKRVALEQTGDATSRESRRAQAAIDRVYRSSAIDMRSSVVPDYVSEPDAFTFYPSTWSLSPSPSTADRMAVYRREAPPLAMDAVLACLSEAPAFAAADVTHLIVVTCTGFFAPGLDTFLVKELGLRRDVERSVIGFMGCYAAFPALRAASAICAARPDAVVLVVCIELCSIHFQNDLSMDNVVANCLFGDGAAAVLVTADSAGDGAGGFRMVDSWTRIEDDSEDQMTWTVTDTGFQMTLSADVPATLERGIEPFVTDLLRRNGMGIADVAFWAVHPGGRRIVDVVREQLALPDGAADESYDVLRQNGNMSSPTILFVLDACRRRGLRTGDRGVALAFGPGLTLESMLLEAG